MDEVGRELDRLRRGWSAARAHDLAWGIHLSVLVLAVAAAWGSRLLGPWPLLGRLEGRMLAALGVAALLLVLGPLLRLLLGRILGVSRLHLAHRLDDDRAWGDAADTALGLPGGPTVFAVESFLRAQTAGRLRDLEPARLWVRRLAGRWKSRFLFSLVFLLLFLFLFALLAPGVGGLFGEGGAGWGESAGVGTRPEEDVREPFDADLWLREHARLALRATDAKERPLGLTVRLRTDRPLPEPYAGDLEIVWDGEAVGIGALEAEAGERVDRRVDLDLGALQPLAEQLTPGRHVVQARLTPRRGPWEAPLESNRQIVVLEEGGGGSGREGPPRPAPQPEPELPEPEPESPEPPPTRMPNGEEEKPAPPPPDEGRVEVVDPLVRHEDEKVEKPEAVVAVPDPEAGLEPPPLVGLEEALGEFERVVERAMGDERLRGADRTFLLRYFRALRAAAGKGAPR